MTTPMPVMHLSHGAPPLADDGFWYGLSKLPWQFD
jgi:hypothetical protein